MKAIMISIKPKWCALMMNGIKTIEVRKNKALATAIQKLIDENGYADIYVYCCKNNKQRLYPVALLDKSNQVFKRAYREDKIDNRTNYLNGKVAFKFRCYKVEEWDIWQEDLKEKLKLACLSIKEFDDYSKGQVAYAIHISDLEIYDKPKELSEFRKPSTLSLKQLQEFGLPYTEEMYKDMMKCGNFIITKAPQNFCYVEE